MRINGTSTDAGLGVRSATTPTRTASSPKTYQYATPDGRFVYFSSGEKLTNNSQAEPGVPDLYRYDVASGDAGRPDHRRSRRRRRPGRDRRQRQRQPRLLRGQRLARARRRRPAGSTSTSATARTTTFITALDPRFEDTSNWAPEGSSKTGRVTPSGSALLFSSRAPQLGYDNAGLHEFYVYDLASDSFQCISCRPNGEPGDRRRGNRPAADGRDLAQRPADLRAPQPVRGRLDGVLHQPRPAASTPTRTASTTPTCGSDGDIRAASRPGRASTSRRSSTPRRAATTRSS